jgi:O-antigen ligase
MHVFDRSMAENNIAAMFAVFGLAALGGSLVTGLLAVSGIWALICLATGRLSRQRDPALFGFGAVLLLYVGVNALFFLVHFGENFDSSLAEFRKLAPLLLFLTPLFLMQRLAVSRGGDLLVAMSRAAAIGALAVLPLALFQTFVLDMRAEGGSGNAIPFAMTCALLSSLSLPSLLDADRRWRLLGILGFVAGYLCIFLSQTKGLMPAPLVAAIIFGIFFLRKRVSGAQILLGAALVLVVAVVGFFVSGSGHRFSELSKLAAGSNDIAWGASYTVRLDLWIKAFDLIQSGFFDGHGIQNRRALIQAAGHNYSHFHNGFITALVDGGVLGLIALVVLLVAPFVIALRAARDAFYGMRLFMAFCLVMTYVLGGMTNFIFGHDIYDAMFLWISTVIVVSAVVSTNTDALGDPKGATAAKVE